MLDDTVQIGVGVVEDLVQPVGEFHVGVAPHLAKDRSPFNGLVGHGVQFAEKRGARDFHARFLGVVDVLAV